MQLLKPSKYANLSGHSCIVNYILIYNMIFTAFFCSVESGIMCLEWKEHHCCSFLFPRILKTSLQKNSYNQLFDHNTGSMEHWYMTSLFNTQHFILDAYKFLSVILLSSRQEWLFTSILNYHLHMVMSLSFILNP